MKFLLLALYATIITVSLNDPTQPKQHEMAGVQATWYFDSHQENLCIDLIAPTKGWVAIGFNHKREFIGSNLIMVAADNGTVKAEDQYIERAGVHPTVDALGGISHLIDAQVYALKDGRQQISLQLNPLAQDRFHYALKSGQRIYLTLAYSRFADFQHHSVQRESAWISL